MEHSWKIARENNCAVFTPSSIGSFGLSTPHTQTPQDTVQRPGTIYGVSKVTTELLSDYYFKKYGVDTRSVRFPGLISYVTPPGVVVLLTMQLTSITLLFVVRSLCVLSRREH